MWEINECILPVWARRKSTVKTWSTLNRRVSESSQNEMKHSERRHNDRRGYGKRLRRKTSIGICANKRICSTTRAVN